jgi:branched-chain amino acid transport system substrate-binding protein
MRTSRRLDSGGVPRLLALALVLVLLAAGALACGRDDGVEETRIIGDSLTVYSSQPLRGPLADVSRDVVRAEKLALREAGGRAGAFDVNFVSLDSSDPETGRWDPGRVAANARRAVQTTNTIAYLGELETGASAISLPILNEGGILQVSPRDTFGGLTERGGRGEPEKYYPSGVRNFARVVPPSDRQARLVVAAMADQDVRRLVLADDRQLAGTRLGDRVARLAREAGIEVVDRKRLDIGGEAPEGLGEDVRAERPDAFLYTGAYADAAAEMLQDIHAEAPGVRLYGSDELTLAPELPERAGPAAERLQLTGVDPVETAAFERRFEAAYGERPDRQAVLGYRAMELVLDAIRAAGDDAASRRVVIRRAVESAGRPRARFTRYRVEDERLVTVGPHL